VTFLHLVEEKGARRSMGRGRDRRREGATPLRSVVLGVAAHVGQTEHAMSDEGKSRRLDDLRRKEAEQELSEAERAELEGLFAALDAEEARALGPAAARVAKDVEELRAEKARVEAWTRQLEHIVGEQEKLLADARAYAGRLRMRRAALADEASRLKAS
jgi:DNA repair exonuclease SbcCD ATPase subunit